MSRPLLEIEDASAPLPKTRAVRAIYHGADGDVGMICCYGPHLGHRARDEAIEWIYDSLARRLNLTREALAKHLEGGGQ